MTNPVDLRDAFAGKPLVVLGDLVADEYIHGSTSRISREAPVLIVAEEHREIRPGGAANVVANMAALGAAPRPVGLVGDDLAGRAILEAFSEREIEPGGIQEDPERFTTCKVRVLAGGRNTVRQQMLRIDRVNPRPVAAAILDRLSAKLLEAIDSAAGLVVSDYGEGVVSGVVFQTVLDIARRGDVPVFVDSRSRIAEFLGVDSLTPNEPELGRAAGFELDEPESIERAGRWLLDSSGCSHLVLKRGRNGMALFQPDRKTVHVQAYGSAEVADVTGAGDTVLAAWSLARVSGADPIQAMGVANTAGGLQVTKAGTAVVPIDELVRALR